MDVPLKRLAVIVAGLLAIALFVVNGLIEKEPIIPIVPTPGEGVAVVSSCITCHTDEELLKRVATQEPEEEKSEATSGEG